MSFGDSIDYKCWKGKKIGDVAQKLIKKKKFYKKGKYGAIKKAWKKAVGDEIYEATHIHSWENGKIKIRVKSPVLMHELKGFMKHTILEELKRTDGGEDVKDIIFMYGK